MKKLTLDFETYYDKEYSLKKMTPVEYILDPRFECTGLAVKRGTDKAFWVEGDEVEDFFRSEPEDVMAISHNALFDMCICYFRYGWSPKMMCDTLGISRSLFQAFLRSLSLESVANHLGLGQKDKGALANVIGMRLADIRRYPEIYQRFKTYGCEDAEMCWGIFEKTVLAGQFPPMELAVMDAVLRCAVQPQFVINQDKLHQSLGEILKEKDEILASAMLLGIDDEEKKSQLMSNDKFAALLEQLGVDPPTKISGTTGKVTWAFAKQDQEFLDLLEHPSPAVQAVMAARFGHKSTIEETRHQRFINISNLHWPETKVTSGGNLRLMPMPLRYGGAHTHRLSGDWKLNVQNMGRGSTLRSSLEAPPGYVVVAGDESQVEARFVCTLCGQEDMRAQFERGEDVYSIFASDLFNMQVTKANKIERFIGKQCILGLGFGLGDEKFTKSIPILAWNQLRIRMTYTPDEGKKAVTTYRTKNPYIKNTWKLLNTQGINALLGGGDWKWGPVWFRKERIELPNGMFLYYHNLRQEAGGRFGTEWVFEYAGKKKRIYGGKLLENIVQALARIITMEAAVRVRLRLARLGIPLALQVHDELVFVVKKEHEAITKLVLEHELKQRPAWLPNLPLDCEVGSGPSYGDAK
ncbi:DNA polymerase I protein [Rhizobium phage RHph_TM3_14A]|nr:DNA polymerase I protein [Rhizobium phage RHph_TM27A]QIG66978.1 DNA polymerase I protein [Rhizobium phage RHph_TM27B]QIG67067.1 DNA polymerase I protein [Rhizobium phage RHph_TM29]QIG67523.1 DNA polymerase I protein [Rhizobium phage RHph_TM3_14A]